MKTEQTEQIDSKTKPAEENKKEEKKKAGGKDSDDSEDFDIQPHVRIATLGNVDSGKSTLTGLLISSPGTLDDGRGAMRDLVATEEEKKVGRTHSIGQEIMGFKENGQ